MLTPDEMLTNKKRLQGCVGIVLLAAAVAWLSGCTPAGPRALLRGKRLMEQGKYADAVDELKTATSLIPTNALAWNYLGLAYHHANQPANAVEAYQRALKINHDLFVVHYDLGCLYLEENRPDTIENARNELYAFVLRQENSPDGWLKLGIAQLRLAQLRLNELVQAEASFKNVLRLSPQNVEAMNDLGLIQLDRRHYRDAMAWFNAALKLQPNYPSALLNLAVTEGYMNNPSGALEKYQAYLAINPRPANWDAVNAIAQQLDQQLNPQLRPPTNAVASYIPATNTQNHPNTTPTNLPKPEPVASAPRPTYTQPKPVVSNEPAVKPEIVRLPESPGIRPARPATSSTSPSSQVVTADSEILGQPSDLPEESKSEKRGFFSKLNVFHRSPQPTPKTTPAPILTPQEPGDGVITLESNGVAKPSSPPVSTARYPYLSTVKIVPGNRQLAERYMAQGVEAQRERRLSEALRNYRAAAQTDSSYFDAQSSLGLAAFDSGNLPESLRAYEYALAINPESFIARYNFALALKRANYLHDAVRELERLLASSGAETPEHLAMVHLTLANIYSEQFHQSAPARAHYLKVLELDPHNSQATSIRYWLQQNG